MAVLAEARTSFSRAGSWVGPLKEMVITWQPRFSHSARIWAALMSYFLRICGNCVRRMPMKPVSCMMSRISVKGTGGKEFQRLAPRAHFRFLLAGMRLAARANVAPKRASAVRRVIRLMMLLEKPVERGAASGRGDHARFQTRVLLH